jgi:hypothetical protein
MRKLRAVFRLGLAVFMGAIVLTGEARTVQSAPYNPQFHLQLMYSGANVNGLIPGDRVVGSLRDRAGKIVGVAEGIADSYGFDYLNFYGSYAAVFPGYKATFRIYDSAGVQRGTYSAIAPAMTFSALDKARSIARGTGPAGKPYSVTWYHPNLNAGNTYLFVAKEGSVPSTRAWAADFGTTSFRGGDWINFEVRQSTRFTFSRSMTVPFLSCYLAENYCWLAGFPNQGAALTIVHAGTPYSFTGRFSLSGYFSAQPVDADGMPVLLAAGDMVSGTGVGSFVLPTLTAAIDFSTDVVSGKAPAGRYISVRVQRLATNQLFSRWVRSNAAGNYSADFSPTLDLTDMEGLLVSVTYVNPASGNETSLDQPFGP